MISVDFQHKKGEARATSRPIMPADDVAMQVFLIEDEKVIGLTFNQPVKEFRMDVANADALLGTLVQAIMKLKGGAS